MLCTYNVSAAIPGGGGGPSHLHNDVYKCPLPKTKKATNAKSKGAIFQKSSVEGIIDFLQKI